MPCSAKFCLIASGEADLYPRYGKTMEWDTAAGSALVSASGGKIISIDDEGELLYKKPGLVNRGFLAYSKRLANIHEFC
jgi:3'(2'), 5'-bisphosphate nucleotidase